MGPAVTPYQPRMPLLWWLRRPAYTRFVIREFTSVFLAAYVILVLVLAQRVEAGPEAYAAYLRWLASPGLLAFHVVALAAALYHTATWLSLAPLAVVLHVGGRRVPPTAIVVSNVVIWIAVSILLGWLVLRT